MTRGPIPDERAGRNATHKPAIPTTELGSDPVDLELAPKLSQRERKKLLAVTRRWWDAVVTAPQASQFGVTDWQRLKMVVLPLVERFNRELSAKEPDPNLLVKLADAIARQEKEFGLTPESRLRLRWSLRPKGGAGSGDGEAKPTTKKPRETKADPRRLEVVAGGKS